MNYYHRKMLSEPITSNRSLNGSFNINLNNPDTHSTRNKFTHTLLYRTTTPNKNNQLNNLINTSSTKHANKRQRTVDIFDILRKKTEDMHHPYEQYIHMKTQQNEGKNLEKNRASNRKEREKSIKSRMRRRLSHGMGELVKSRQMKAKMNLKFINENHTTDINNILSITTYPSVPEKIDHQPKDSQNSLKLPKNQCPLNSIFVLNEEIKCLPFSHTVTKYKGIKLKFGLPEKKHKTINQLKEWEHSVRELQDYQIYDFKE